MNFGADEPSNVAMYMPVLAWIIAGVEKSVSEDELSPKVNCLPL